MAGEPASVPINDEVLMTTGDDLAVVWVRGAPWHRFVSTNELDRRIVAANLVVAGLAKTVEVERALGINRMTQHRDRERMLEGGLAALASLRKGPQGPTKARPELRRRARRLSAAGHSGHEIARRLGVSARTVRRMLKGAEAPEKTVVAPQSLEPTPEPETAEPSTAQPGTATSSEFRSHTDEPPVPSGFEPAEPHPETTCERDLDRSLDRFFARLGLLIEAPARLVSGERLQWVGALLIVPVLAAMGFFRGVQEVYGKLNNGFYGLRHTIMTLVLMATLRLKRAEHLRGAPPAALGRLLGLDRAPEVKTLRRKLREIAARGRADKLLRWFGQKLASDEPDVVGYLYIDGHVRPYFGKHQVSKAHVTRMRIAMPASSDFWVNDTRGDPFFVVTGEVTASLTDKLLPILEQLRPLLPEGARPTVVFDRGGWSPKLFKEILEAGFHILTYRKGRCPVYPAGDFAEHRLSLDGQKHTYLLRDGWVNLGVGLRLRAVVRLKKGHQTHIVTSDKESPPAVLACRMFGRWGQENYFKYGIQEFALDALDTYQVQPEDPGRTVPNPARRKIEKSLRTLRKEAKELEAEFGRAADANEEARRPTARGVKIAHGKLRQRLAKLRQKIETLVPRRRRLPERVGVQETAKEGKQVVRMAVEHKHFMNIVKMAVCRAESALLRLLDAHYRRNDQEGRALLREAFRSCGSLEVSQGVLRVTLDPLSEPRRSRAIAALCSELNDTRTRLPGTSLRLEFAVRDGAET